MTQSQEFCEYLETPVGLLEICASDSAITSIYFADDRRIKEQSNEISRLAVIQLTEYFAGKRMRFELPLMASGTGFQQRVWQQLVTVPYGQTCSYGDIANKLSNPKAVRAVGAANGKNPISIVVPCHRVIGANGTLTGYAGGMDRKAWLLKFESPQMSVIF